MCEPMWQYEDIVYPKKKRSVLKRTLIALAALVGISTSAGAATMIDITVDISDQEMYVQMPEGDAVWPVSTGRRGYDTPVGDYQPTRIEEMWYSSKYENAPMPYSIFFSGGYAIHGTEYEDRLGTRASHGCIRLSEDNASVLYELVDYYGMENVNIRVQP